MMYNSGIINLILLKSWGSMAQSTQDKLLFTPGPLTTSHTVKEMQLHDYGSRDATFISAVKEIRQELVALACEVHREKYTTVLMQGSGTFAIEAVISSTLGRDDKLLVLINGAYGRRMTQMADVLGIAYSTLEYSENDSPKASELDAYLASNDDVTMVAVVHCETTTGILNPIAELAGVVRKHKRQLFVDAMSSFGAIPVDVGALGITYLVSSANKCIEGVPGFAYVIADVAALEATKGKARSLSFDLYAQWQGLEKNGQFRFTPPVQSIMAFRQALKELAEEGGVVKRGERYQRNNTILLNGMLEMGFKPYLTPSQQSYIITTFLYPEHPNFDFAEFYDRLSERGFVIYPGKLTEADCFRLGNIGRLDAEHIEALLGAIGETLNEMEVSL
jgi:2-aminoethylphosphonate-pyruvate transaminase